MGCRCWGKNIESLPVGVGKENRKSVFKKGRKKGHGNDGCWKDLDCLWGD